MLKVKRGQGGGTSGTASLDNIQHSGQSCTWHWCSRYTQWIVYPCDNRCCRCLNHRYKPRNCCCCHKRCCRPCRPYRPYVPYYPPYTTGPWIGNTWGTAADYNDQGNYTVWSASGNITDTSGLINLKNTQWT